MYKQNIDVGCRKFEQCGQAVVLTRKLLSLVCLTAISPPFSFIHADRYPDPMVGTHLNVSDRLSVGYRTEVRDR